MAVEQRQFESEFGFKSPGFSVDALGNITATWQCPQAQVAAAEQQQATMQ